MHTINVRKIMRKIAKENNTSVMEVKREIAAAISYGMNNPLPNVQEFWSCVPRTHTVPTTNELIRYITKL